MGAEITAVLSSEDGYFHAGYADSIAVTDSRVYVRENWGVSVYGHGYQPQLAHRWDIQSRPGYTKTGDGFQVISGVGASSDGARVLAGWKTDNHGTLILKVRWSGNHAGPDGDIVGEFAPPKALGGVTVAHAAGRYYGLSLTTSALWCADITADRPGRVTATPSVPGGLYGSLIADGEMAAYVTARGELVTCRFPFAMTTSIDQIQATCVALERGIVLAGCLGGMRRGGGALIPLPGTPQAVTLLGGVAYAWLTVGGIQRLYREGEEILALDAAEWPVVVSRGFADRLYVGNGQHVMVIRVG